MTLAQKKASSKAAAKKTPGKRAATPAAVDAARESLVVFAAQQTSPINVGNAAIATLAHMSPGLVQVTPARIVPPNLLELAFDDSKVGLSNEQMPAFFSGMSIALNNHRVAALIQKNLADSANAAAIIITVTDLIQFWIDNPELTA